MDMKCTKSKLADYAEIQGWLKLYDKQNDGGSEIGYLLPDGCGLTAYFDAEANFRVLSDVNNVNMSAEDEN